MGIKKGWKEMMTLDKGVLDESPALHAKPGNFQRKLTRMTLKATCEPTTPSYIES